MRKAKDSIKLIIPIEYLNYLSFCNKDLRIELLTFGKDIFIRNCDFSDITVHDGLEIDISSFGDLKDYLDKTPLPHKQYTKSILILIDEDEMMYVPPYPEKTKPGITSQNPYLVEILTLLFEAIYEKTPELKLK